MIRFSKRYAYDGIVKKSKVYSEENLKKVKDIHQLIRKREGEGSEMMGWLDYVNNPETEQILEQMLLLYKQWEQEKINTVLVAGIGGSSLGARAAIHMCVNKYMQGAIKVIWMDSISCSSTAELLKHLKKNRIKPAAIVISKSGTTFETLINYRFIKAVMIYKYGEENFHDKLAIVCGEEDNQLKQVAQKMQYTMFSIPKNIGGRFSTLTPVGLLPMIMSGIDVFQVVDGAKDALKDLSSSDLSTNSAYDYALHRYMYYQAGYKNEVLDTYEKKLSALLEQWKQMTAETEAKDEKGIMPITATYTKDLHSVGQYLQDGPKTFFETTLWIRRANGNAKVPADDLSNDKLDYLSDSWLSEINRLVYRSVAEAHAKVGKTPVLLLELDKMTPYDYGYFYMWLSISVTMSAYLLGVNPFNQPGVEAYKNLLKQHLKTLEEKIKLQQNQETSEEELDTDGEDIKS